MIHSVRRILVTGSAFAALALLGVQAAPAQDAAPSSATDIPDDVSVAKMDPDNRHASAKVNGEIITGTDVEQRVALIVAANEGVEISDEEMQRLRQQVMRNLIDETLEIQEAAAQDMAVTKQEVDEYYLRYAAQRFGRTPEKLDEYLKSVGSSPASLKRQIEGELAWDRLLQRNVRPFVNVSAEEVNELYQRLQAAKGTPEYKLSEIYLSSTPETHEAVGENAKRIVEQLRQGGSFLAYARQFSEASTAAVGGDLGWIKLEQLQNPTLETVARNMQPGQLVGPIEIPGGYSILYLQDKRQVGMADPRDAVLSLKQISLEFPKGTSEEEAKAKAAAFAQAATQIKGCGDADAAGKAMGAQVVTNDNIPVRALPEALQQTMLKLNVGETTPPFGSLEEGVRVLMLCGRDDPSPEAGPNYDQLMAQLEDDRVGKRAQRYLRDLRRDAVVEDN
ncbi:peptidylprolyl isomerase [Croceibacterium aestuarii]|uniref:peptidylprolyl isomerase n=1 Tax=Croceibacterium aestuarii TaxID=3064139 RepID=UPI00272E28F5|nr:peptidylprolyl isomerase [Croceibacterium sp. D39]